jgi:regulator of sigma E protease
MLVSVVSVALVLGGLIFAHELGHFLAARSFGMGVLTFSLGFGPKILGKRFGKTEYRLSAVPLGGYVALVGEQEEDEELPEGFDRTESFSLRPPWQRLIVAFAGPFANLLLAWFICWGLAVWHGEAEIRPHIGAVEANSPAALAGLLPGDTVLAVNELEIQSWRHMAERIAQSGGAPLRLDIRRERRNLTVNVTPAASVRKNIFGEDEQAFRIGVRASGEYSVRELGFFEAASAGLARSREMLVLTWQGMVKLVQRVAPLDQVGGPIMIARLVGEQAREGLTGVLGLTALVSINLAVLNLLPIPVLDGGTILFCALETLMRRPLSRRLREITARMGLAFLICLMLLATFNDIWRLARTD